MEKKLFDTEEIVEIDLREDVSFAEAELDLDNDIIKNVALLGKYSKNNREYSEKAMDQAELLLNGAKSFLDHPTKQQQKTNENRSVKDLIGRVENTYTHGSQIRGNLILLESKHKNLIKSIAERMPEVSGFSINAAGKTYQKDGKEIVESFTKIFSVDLVEQPATVSTVFEGKEEITVENLYEKHYTVVTELIDSLTIEQLKNSQIWENIVSEVDDYHAKYKDTLEKYIKLKLKLEDAQKELRESKENLKEMEIQKEAEKTKLELDYFIKEQINKLPKKASSDTFMNLLRKADTKEEILNMIDDRLAMLKKDAKTESIEKNETFNNDLKI